MTNPSPHPQPPNFWDTLLDVLPGDGTTTNTSVIDPFYTVPTGTVVSSGPIKTRRAPRSHLKPGNRVHTFKPTEVACAVCLATRPWPEGADTIVFGHAACEEHANDLRVHRSLDAVIVHHRWAG